MAVQLPDLGDSYSCRRVAGGGSLLQSAKEGIIQVQPGVYVLSHDPNIEIGSLPQNVGRVGLTEFVAPTPQDVELAVLHSPQPQSERGQPLLVSATIVDSQRPEEVLLFARNLWRTSFQEYPMQHIAGYRYQATIPKKSVNEGLVEYCITVEQGGRSTTFPCKVDRNPKDWDFHGTDFWQTMIVDQDAPVILFAANKDATDVNFTRIDRGYFPVTRIVSGQDAGQSALRIEINTEPKNLPEDYSATLFIGDRVSSRLRQLDSAKDLQLKVRGIGHDTRIRVTLIEHDGTSWSKMTALRDDWQEVKLSVSELELSKSAQLPLGYPGRWGYWLESPEKAEGTARRLNFENIERIQFSLRRHDQVVAESDLAHIGFEIESAVIKR